MTAQQAAGKHCVVKLSDEEREWLSTLILYRQTPCASDDEGRFGVKAGASDGVRRGLE